MSPLLRSTYISIICSTLIFLAYGFYVFQVTGVDYFTGPEALVRIGKSIGVLIIAGYAFEWGIQLTALLLSARRSAKLSNSIIVDERDKLINYRSLARSANVLVIGMVASIGALAMGAAPFWVFHILVLFYALGVITELASKIYFYRTGI